MEFYDFHSTLLNYLNNLYALLSFPSQTLSGHSEHLNILPLVSNLVFCFPISPILASYSAYFWFELVDLYLFGLISCIRNPLGLLRNPLEPCTLTI